MKWQESQLGFLVNLSVFIHFSLEWLVFSTGSYYRNIKGTHRATNTVQQKAFILLLFRIVFGVDMTELYLSVYHLNHWHAFIVSKPIPVPCIVGGDLPRIEGRILKYTAPKLLFFSSCLTLYVLELNYLEMYFW